MTTSDDDIVKATTDEELPQQDVDQSTVGRGKANGHKPGSDDPAAAIAQAVVAEDMDSDGAAHQQA